MTRYVRNATGIGARPFGGGSEMPGGFAAQHNHGHSEGQVSDGNVASTPAQVH